ncbi:hypothetical protein [Thermoleptolyngbya sp.]
MYHRLIGTLDWLSGRIARLHSTEIAHLCAPVVDGPIAPHLSEQRAIALNHLKTPSPDRQ